MKIRCEFSADSSLGHICDTPLGNSCVTDSHKDGGDLITCVRCVFCVLDVLSYATNGMEIRK